jgi:indole-3-glycerol phosphate synthase
MSDILNKIVAVKREEVAAGLKKKPLAAMREDAESRVLTRDFVGAMRAKIAAGQAAVIAEVKKASPSRGVLREDFIAADIAQSYAEHRRRGQRGLPVGVDRPQFFQGNVDYLKQARAVVPAAGAAQGFHDRRLADLRIARHGCRCHPADRRLPGRRADGRSGGHRPQPGHGCAGGSARPRRARARTALKTPLIGINNRNLRTFEVTIQTTLALRADVPPGRLLVTESGILSRADVRTMRDAKVDAFLVGEAFMRAPDPGLALAELFA